MTTSTQKASLASARCKVLRHNMDGHVFVRTIEGKTFWVAELECAHCGTRRIDHLVPRTMELVSRHYEWLDTYDRKMDQTEARKVLYKSMITPE